MSTTTAPRYTAERLHEQWVVVRVEDGVREVVGDFPSRDAARQNARRLNETPAPAEEHDDTAAEHPGENLGDVVADTVAAANEADADVEAGEAPEKLSAAEETRRAHEASKICAQVYRELHPAPGKPEKLAHDRKITLARVVVGDQLMTNMKTDGNGRVWVDPHRFTDGQVRTVDHIATRKAGPGEMPGTLYTLGFTDGTTTDTRYGTTSHYLAPDFTRPETSAQAATPAPAADKAKHRAASAGSPPKAEQADKAPKVPTEGSRAGKLEKGSRLVLRDLGVVTVDEISKTGGGKLEVAFTDAKGDAGVREMWTSTNVRIAAAGE